jgi:hypothetical protein
MEMVNLKKLKKVKVKEKCHVEVSSRFAALEDLNAELENTVLGKLLQKVQQFQTKGI